MPPPTYQTPPGRTTRVSGKTPARAAPILPPCQQSVRQLDVHLSPHKFASLSYRSEETNLETDGPCSPTHRRTPQERLPEYTWSREDETARSANNVRHRNEPLTDHYRCDGPRTCEAINHKGCAPTRYREVVLTLSKNVLTLDSPPRPLYYIATRYITRRYTRDRQSVKLIFRRLL